MDKILSASKMDLWSPSPEQGKVKRLSFSGRTTIGVGLQRLKWVKFP